ncbi:alpha/beta fold hydrolase [Azoarcus sp. L1K30]|uniref:alpha/beta hydrolase n=1 Tax=Azoarcus sp. L1K30 TaxID=2820277 RepID=UPI001B8313A1|nr:alpha/beta fold hydrolase [Azoarcus sp. L1K30]MBR0567670.1 alpha/beta fold hydrolase [Azoarcus sp. L1K30]
MTGLQPFHLLYPLALGGVLLALRAGMRYAIRTGLAAPRIAETAGPESLGLGFSTEFIPTANGKSLHAWLIPPDPDADAAGTVIVLHGWGGNAQMMLPLARPLHEAGWAALFIDARCHGRSDGDSFASLPRFAEDVEAAFEWLVARPGSSTGRLVLLGHSVGAGAVLLAATRRREVAAVVSVSAFAHPADMMRSWLAAKRIPRWIEAYILDYVQATIGFRFDDIAPLTSIAHLHCPVLLVHGEHDEVVPVADASRLHAARAHDRVELLTLPGNHASFEDMAQDMNNIIAFLRAAPAVAPSAAADVDPKSSLPTLAVAAKSPRLRSTARSSSP